MAEKKTTKASAKKAEIIEATPIKTKANESKPKVKKAVAKPAAAISDEDKKAKAKEMVAEIKASIRAKAVKEKTNPTKTEVQKADKPKRETTKAAATKVKAEAPKAEEPKQEEPKQEKPKQEKPKQEKPKAKKAKKVEEKAVEPETPAPGNKAVAKKTKTAKPKEENLTTPVAKTAKAKAEATETTDDKPVAEKSKTKAKTKSKATKEPVVEATPVKPSRRKIPKVEKVVTEDVAEKATASIKMKGHEQEEAESKAVMERIDSITETPLTENPFAKYNDIIEEDEKNNDNETKKIRPVKKDDNAATTSKESDTKTQDTDENAETGPSETDTNQQDKAETSKSKGGRNKHKEDKTDDFMIDDASASISSLTKGNVWATDVDEIYKMLLEGRRTEHWAENETHYMNIIRPVYDIRFFDKKNKDITAAYEAEGFKTYNYPTTATANNAIAIRKHKIKKITDLTMENILHLEAYEVLKLISENLGTGWKGLPLAIQDIIETAFYVDQSTLPETAMHRTGGIIDRRKADGYEVLEIPRGTWIEAVFLKYKPRMEKMHFESIANRYNKENEDTDDEEDDIDDETDEEDDEIDKDDEIDDEPIEEEPQQIEDFEDLPSDEEDDNE